MCKKPLQEYHIDHIIPLSKWWPHSIWNIQILCPFCNMSKYNK
jgi:5-methylcytosine-specific restriction endonuclease McrA